MKSILARAQKSNIVSQPFPYLVIHPALDHEIYEQLVRDYPTIDYFTRGSEIANNARYQISAYKALEDRLISPLWRDFINYHVSHQFYQEVISLFGEHIRRLYPWLESSFSKDLEELTTGVRWIENDLRDCVLDCQPGINSPVISPTRVRGPHVDNPVELFAGLLYMRDDNDDSNGGDLEIYRFKNSSFIFHGKAEVEDKYVEKIATIPYSKNTLVFFINSLYSLHGVTARSITHHPRRLVNFIGELYTLPDGGLFKLKRRKHFNLLATARQKFKFKL